MSCKWRELCDPRVHEQHINFAKFLRNLRIQLVDVRELCYIALHPKHAVADYLRRLVQRFPAAARNGDSCSFFLQALRRGQPDAAVAPGYNCYFSFESLHDVLRSLSELYRKLLSGDGPAPPLPVFSGFRYLDEHRSNRLHLFSGISGG